MPSHLFFGESTLAPSPVLLSAGIFLFFGLTYTAWDKSERRLSLENLKDVVLARRGVAHTLVELNKILALTGMAVLPLAYLAFDNAKEHIQLALWGQLVHATYSTYKYYGDKIPYVSGYLGMIFEMLDATSKKTRLVGIKRLSVVCGFVSLILITAQVFVRGYSVTAINIAVLVTALVHFIAMEVDYKLVLQVRTTGNWTIPLTLLSIGALALRGGSDSR